MLTKVCVFKAMLFPVVVYGCEGWTIKRAECRRIDAFELWCWDGVVMERREDFRTDRRQK